MPFVRQPFADKPEWMVLVDLGLSGGLAADAALEALFEAGTEAGLVSDGMIASNAAQRQELWRMREAIPEANRLIGAITSHDISVPIETIPDFIRRAGALVAGLGPLRVNCFGHVAVYPPKWWDLCTRLNLSQLFQVILTKHLVAFRIHHHLLWVFSQDFLYL